LRDLQKIKFNGFIILVFLLRVSLSRPQRREFKMTRDDLCAFEIPDRAALVRKKEEVGKNSIKNFLFPPAGPGTRDGKRSLKRSRDLRADLN
jgi:hypothetical protein